MEKEIQNYLYLYLGCECKIENPTINSITKILGGFDDEGEYKILYKNEQYTDAVEWHSISRIKPILRPLSDMQIKEAAEYADFYQNSPIPDECTIEVKPKEKWVHISITSPSGDSGISLFPGNPNGERVEAFRYLLSKHFDIFGLIEAGLAIDKTKIK